MTNWPDKPLIRVIRGRDLAEIVEDAIAIRVSNGNYLSANNSFHLTASSDSIDEWEEVSPIPTAALKRLQQEFRGVNVIRSLEPPLLEVLSYLPADKPSPLDQAVATVKDVAKDPLVDAETLPADRLSLLLDALASVQSATRKTIPLAIVARICADWANVEGARGDSLEVVRRRVEALSDTGSFIILSALVGDVTTTMREDFSPRHDLIDAGAYALAWVAQIIEEEDK